MSRAKNERPAASGQPVCAAARLADAVYSLAGAAGRTATYSDKDCADVSDNSSSHSALSPVNGGGGVAGDAPRLSELTHIKKVRGERKGQFGAPHPPPPSVFVAC